ncbi:MAG: dCMP deaminase family protein [Clostridia bacterium]|nr:dCMP deaminase family protein [Clostridia bacterium]
MINKWDERFMQLAEVVSTWSSCYQENRHVGAVVVKDKRILTTGYNGAPVGIKSCADRGVCLRRERNIPSGTMQEVCYAVHAEQNAICQAAKMGISLEGATLYCTHQPCVICARIIINSGIKKIIFKYGYPDEFAMQLFNEAGMEVVKYDDLDK